MDLNTQLLAQIAVALDAMQLQLDYNRALLIDSIGGEPVINGASDNVGIGTNAPTHFLTVKNDIDDTTPTLGVASGKFGILLTSLYGMQMGVNSSGNAWVQVQRIDSTATAYNLLLQPSGGNVGINKIAPLSKLSVVGLPTSATGLTPGDVWIDGSTLKIVT